MSVSVKNEKRDKKCAKTREKQRMMFVAVTECERECEKEKRDKTCEKKKVEDKKIREAGAVKRAPKRGE